MPRWVIDLPGSPGVDAIDSTSFSDWIQPADQTATAVTLSSSTVTPESGGSFVSYDETILDPPAPDDLGDVETTALADELSTLSDGSAGITEGSLAISHTAWSLVAGGDPADDDPLQLQHVLNGKRGGSGATIAARARELFWNEDWLPSAPPPDAIGYEVQMAEPTPGNFLPIAEPLSAELQLALAPTTYFGTVANAEVIAVLNTLWGEGPVEFTFAGPLLDLIVHRLAPSTLSAVEDNHYARVSVFAPYAGAMSPPHVETISITDLSEAPPYTGLIGLHATVKNFGGTVHVEDGNMLVVSANASVSGLYTIRPPRIRWIYGTPETAPYRRIYPRHDSLAGGPGRNYPRSKAVQTSNRTSGYL